MRSRLGECYAHMAWTQIGPLDMLTGPLLALTAHCRPRYPPCRHVSTAAAAAATAATATACTLQSNPTLAYPSRLPPRPLFSARPRSTSATKQFLNANYGELHVSSYADTCKAPVNLPCQTFQQEGCSLWALAQKHCKGDQKHFAQQHGLIYSGNSHQAGKHVIGVPCDDVRGVEDVPANKHNAITITGPMWPKMWTDMTTNAIPGGSGYRAETGALVINTPSNREYHQLHIHAGDRTSQFDACIKKMTYKSNEEWQLVTCDGLQEGGDLNQTKLSAQLLYKTVKSLDGVWDAYNKGVALTPAAGGLNIGGTDTSKCVCGPGSGVGGGRSGGCLMEACYAAGGRAHEVGWHCAVSAAGRSYRSPRAPPCPPCRHCA